MKRATLVLAALALLLSYVGPADADMIVLNDSGEGWLSLQFGSDGNTSSNNYIAGSSGAGQFRDHFDFSIPTLSGALTGATLTLDNSGGHEGGATTTFTVSGLGVFGTYGYSDIGTGTEYGSVAISASGTVTITLDAAALAALSADQGGTFSLGGVDSGEAAFPRESDDFYGSGFSFTPNTLTLETTSAVPEPSSLALIVTASVTGLGYFGWRRRRTATA